MRLSEAHVDIGKTRSGRFELSRNGLKPATQVQGPVQFSRLLFDIANRGRVADAEFLRYFRYFFCHRVEPLLDFLDLCSSNIFRLADCGSAKRDLESTSRPGA